MAQLFTPAQIAAVQKAMSDAEAGKQICQKGAACGFDTAADYAVLHATQQRLAEVLRQFVPNGVSPS